MKKTLLILLFLLPALMASRCASAAEMAQQKFSGKVIGNPDRVETQTDSIASATPTVAMNRSFVPRRKFSQCWRAGCCARAFGT